VERIVAEYLDNADLMQILKKTDKVVGVDLAVAKSPAEFPKLSKQTSVGAMHKEPDYEKVLSLNPNILLVFSNITEEKKMNLPGVCVLFAGFTIPICSILRYLRSQMPCASWKVCRIAITIWRQRT
jgi:iron complex transport system substrate-binding protein